MLRNNRGQRERRRIDISGWWKDICDLYEGEGGVGMKSELKREVGRGENTTFWTNLWVGEASLCESFQEIVERQKRGKNQ